MLTETSQTLIFHLFIALSSLVILAKSADMVVFGISSYAKKLGISDYLIGFLVVSIGTAIPELVASITGAMESEGAIAFGTVFGSNIFKIPLMGLVILIAGRIKNTQNVATGAPIVTLFIVNLPILLIIDGTLSRIDGFILIIAFCIYIARLWQGEGNLGKMEKDVRLKNIWKDGLIFTLALAALLLSARYLVHSSIQISNILNISPYIIGLIVIGVGASAPEVMVQLRSIFKRHQDIAFGNVIGSLVANSALVLGITALITPVYINPRILIISSIFMVLGSIYSIYVLSKKEINMQHGTILIALYIVFLIFEWIF